MDLTSIILGAGVTGALTIIGFLVKYFITDKDKDLKGYAETLKAIAEKLEILTLDFGKFYATIQQQAKTWSHNTDRIDEITKDITELKQQINDLRRDLSLLRSEHEHHHK